MAPECTSDGLECRHLAGVFQLDRVRGSRHTPSMGFFKRNQSQQPKPPAPVVPVEQRAAPSAVVVTGELANGPVTLTGTTTFGKSESQALFRSRGLGDGGMIEAQAVLVSEPSNPADPAAVAVHVEGARIGYLPGFIATSSGISGGASIDGQVQLWAALDKGDLRVIGWVAATRNRVTWEYSPANPPPVTIEQQTAAKSTATTHMVDDALNGWDPNRALQFKNGMVGGYHYLETIEPIKKLKREGRLEEALALCYGAIEGAERARERREPAPGYTIQAAIIHRKRGERDAEIAVLQRWLALCPSKFRKGSAVQERLDKLLGATKPRGIENA